MTQMGGAGLRARSTYTFRRRPLPAAPASWFPPTMRSIRNTLALESVDDYGKRATTVTGGDLRLRDNASLTNTSSITLDYGTLILDNSNLSDNPNRVNDSASLAMNGGSLYLYGRARERKGRSETVGQIVTLSSGSSTISAETRWATMEPPPLAHNPPFSRSPASSHNAATGATVDFARTISGN